MLFMVIMMLVFFATYMVVKENSKKAEVNEVSANAESEVSQAINNQKVAEEGKVEIERKEDVEQKKVFRVNTESDWEHIKKFVLWGKRMESVLSRSHVFAPSFKMNLQLHSCPESVDGGIDRMEDPEYVKEELVNHYYEIIRYFRRMAGNHHSRKLYTPDGNLISIWDTLENKDHEDEYFDLREQIFLGYEIVLDITDAERADLCYQYAGDTEYITPMGGRGNILYYKKEDADLLRYLKNHPNTAEYDYNPQPQDFDFDLQIFAAPVSNETEAVLNNTTDSSETADDVQTTEDINNNKEVGNSAVAEGKSVKEKGGIKMKDFSKQLNNDRLIKKATKKEGNLRVQALQLMPHVDGSVCGILTGIDLPISPANEKLARKNCRLFDSPTLQCSYNWGTDKLLVIDASPVLSDDYIKAALSRMRDRMYMITIKGVRHIAIEVETNKFQSLTAQPDENGNLTMLDINEIKTPKGNFKKNVHIFGGVLTTQHDEDDGCKMNSSSQGRKHQGVCYEVTTKKDRDFFSKMLDEINFGSVEMAKALLGEVDMTEAAELCTRWSAKTTAFAMQSKNGCGIKTYAVLFSADKNVDGSFGWAASCFVDNLISSDLYKEEDRDWLMKHVPGYLIQARPYTVKGAGLVMTDKFMNLVISKRKLLWLNVNNPDHKDLLDAAIKYLSKALRNRNKKRLPSCLKDYDGVVICLDGTDYNVEMFGDIQAFKDMFDYRRISGMNIMSIAHQPKNDFMRARTSAQLLKTFVRVANEYEQLHDMFWKSMMHISMRQLDADFDFSAKPKEFGTEMIDCGYVANVVRDLNPTNISDYPTVYRGMIEDTKLRVEKHINRDAYNVAGHPGMITIDPTYLVWGKSFLEMHEDVVEILDPVFNRYAVENDIDDNRGCGEKYPAMGTLETLLFLFVQNYEERIQKIGKELGASDDETATIIEQISMTKEGTVLLPAELPRIAAIAAGSDEDGDKIIIYFAEKSYLALPTILWMAHDLGWRSRAVEIGHPEHPTTAKVAIKNNLFNLVEIAIDENGNDPTGVVTNGFRTLAAEGILKSNDEAGRRQYWGIFKNVFEAGSLGEGMYISPITVEIRNGIEYHITPPDVEERWLNAVKHMKCIDINIDLALDDLDTIAHHDQELGIDSQKTFDKVDTTIIRLLGKAGYTLLPLVHAIQFDMHWGKEKQVVDVHKHFCDKIGYYVQDGKVVNCSGWSYIGQRKVNVMSDSCAPFRNWVATQALGRLETLRQDYYEKANNPEKAAERQAAYDKVIQRCGSNIRVLARFNLIMKQATTAEHLYRNYIRMLSKIERRPYMTAKQVLAINESINRAARLKFAEMMDACTNELRILAEQENLSTRDLVDLVSNAKKRNGSKDVVSSLAGRLLKEETCRYIAETSEIKEVAREIYGSTAAAVLNFDNVEVIDGMIDETGDRVNLADGIYTVRESVDETSNTLKVELIRPLVDFISIPDADMSRISFQLAANHINKINDLEIGSKCELKLTKVEKNGKEVDAVVMYSNSEAIAEVFCGGFKKGIAHAAQDFVINSAYYNGVVGEFCGINVTEADIDGSQNFLVSLNNVKRILPEEPKQDTVESPEIAEEETATIEDMSDQFAFFNSIC
jgi:hypothetical protein